MYIHDIFVYIYIYVCVCFECFFSTRFAWSSIEFRKTARMPVALAYQNTGSTIERASMNCTSCTSISNNSSAWEIALCTIKFLLCGLAGPIFEFWHYVFFVCHLCAFLLFLFFLREPLWTSVETTWCPSFAVARPKANKPMSDKVIFAKMTWFSFWTHYQGGLEPKWPRMGLPNYSLETCKVRQGDFCQNDLI